MANLAGLSIAILMSVQSASQPTPAPLTTPPDAPTEVEEVIIMGRPLREVVADYVQSVTAPAASAEGLAVWRGTVCIGVADMQPTPAQYMIDRISDIAASLGLEPGAPGCRPNILITATEDGDALATAMVAEHRRSFRTGVVGGDRGSRALADFQRSGSPVRWWLTSLPVHAETGQPAVRLRGQEPFEPAENRTRIQDFGPYASQTAASQLRRNVRDQLQQSIIIIDMKALNTANFTQITDLVAMVALAQINPGSELGGLPSILSLFDEADTPPDGLTEWDWAYLRGLYDSEQNHPNLRGNLSEIIDRMARDRAVQVQRDQP